MRKRVGKPLEKAEQEYCRDCAKQDAAYEQGRSGHWLLGACFGRNLSVQYGNKRNYGRIFAGKMAEHCGGSQIRRWEVEEIIPIPAPSRHIEKENVDIIRRKCWLRSWYAFFIYG